MSALSLVRRRGKTARVANCLYLASGFAIRKLESGEFRMYSRKKDAETGKRKNAGGLDSLVNVRRAEREV